MNYDIFKRQITSIAGLVSLIAMSAAFAADNTFMGGNSGGSKREREPSIDRNVAIGTDALSSMRSGGDTVAIGFHALKNNNNTGTTISDAQPGGALNTAIGFRALEANTYGSANTAVGYSALIANTTGFENDAFGDRALASNTSGSENTAFGRLALHRNTAGYENAASGHGALLYNNTGFRNTAMGAHALLYSETGANNTAVGSLALSSLKNGQDNTAVGSDAGFGRGPENERSLVDSAMTFIGMYASRAGFVDQATPLHNATAIGYNAKVGCKNCMALGGTDEFAVNVGIGTPTPHTALDVNGAVRVFQKSLPACSHETEGSIAYSGAQKGFFGCDGDAWVPLSMRASAGK